MPPGAESAQAENLREGAALGAVAADPLPQVAARDGIDCAVRLSFTYTSTQSHRAARPHRDPHAVPRELDLTARGATVYRVRTARRAGGSRARRSVTARPRGLSACRQVKRTDACPHGTQVTGVTRARRSPYHTHRTLRGRSSIIYAATHPPAAAPRCHASARVLACTHSTARAQSPFSSVSLPMHMSILAHRLPRHTLRASSVGMCT
jgi:hypothetical protein